MATLPLPPSELERLQKILALMHGSTNENEVAVAASKATALLLQYNLSLADAELSLIKDDRPVSFVKESSVHLPEDIDAQQGWITGLMNAVARSCLCQVLVTFFPSKNSRDLITFIGRKREAETALLIFNELVTQMLAMVGPAANEYNRKFKATYGFAFWDRRELGNPHKIKRDWRKSWLLGCTLGIQNTLERQFEEFKEITTPHGSTGSALAILRQDEIAKFIRTEYPHITPFKARKSDLIGDAVRAGRTTGESLGTTAGKPRLS